MSVIVLFLAVIAIIAGWWLSQQQLTAKPWLEASSIGDTPAWRGSSVPAAKVGLGVFLAVAGCLFALLVSAYFMRIEIEATTGAGTAGALFRTMPAPRLLWLNTAALVGSSVALQCTQTAARHGQRDSVRDGLLLGTASALVFLAGQLLVWRQLLDAGYFAASNSANAFFYLFTGVHGLHVVGGIVALGKTFGRVRSGVPIEPLRQSVWLCTTYWHFLLLVWLVIFAVLTGGADDFIVICRTLVI
ncbi:MAG: cytochrome c oxidase subunit 3 [Rhodopila sp.]